MKYFYIKLILKRHCRSNTSLKKKIAQNLLSRISRMRIFLQSHKMLFVHTYIFSRYYKKRQNSCGHTDERTPQASNVNQITKQTALRTLIFVMSSAQSTVILGSLVHWRCRIYHIFPRWAFCCVRHFSALGFFYRVCRFTILIYQSSFVCLICLFALS